MTKKETINVQGTEITQMLSLVVNRELKMLQKNEIDHAPLK